MLSIELGAGGDARMNKERHRLSCKYIVELQLQMKRHTIEGRTFMIEGADLLRGAKESFFQEMSLDSEDQ